MTTRNALNPNPLPAPVPAPGSLEWAIASFRGSPPGT